MPAKIMIIRHAEKPDKDGSSRGIDATGSHDDGSLTVRGWQRAGALAPFFTCAPTQPLELPIKVYASNPTGGSQRPLQTITPLIEKLGDNHLVTTYTKGQETTLASEVRGISGAVLICWQHERIVKIAQALVQATSPIEPIPTEWPDDRFDLVWVFGRRADDSSTYHFTQVPQLLLYGDSPAVIP